MKPYLFVVGAFFLTCIPAFAFDIPSLQLPTRHHESFTLHPQVPDCVPNDGILDPGSWENPLILEGSHGSRYEIKPQVYDVGPNDGLLDAGSLENPWVVTPAQSKVGRFVLPEQ